MTTEELIAAGLPIDPVVEGAEHAAPPSKMLVLLVAPEVAKMGKFNLMMMKMSGMWMLMSAI
jgi:hypothetical protein